jgi:hypothetical protein
VSGTVLITGARAPVAVDLARSFAAAGYQVHLADSVTPWAARWSRAGRRRIHRLPPARWDFPAFAQRLHALVERLQPALVVPTCEEVFYVAEAAHRHGFADRTFAPPLPLLRRLHSKVEFPALARAAGVPAPDTHAVADRDALLSLAASGGDWVLKPEFSRFGSFARVRPSARELAGLDLGGRVWALQRFVAGQEICLWSAVRDGRLLASAAYRPAWRWGQSASYAFERVDAPAAVDVARRIAAHTGMTGHLSFDIILTPQGQAVPIECNPRAVSGLHLFDGGPELAQALQGNAPEVTPPASLRYLAPAMLLLGAPRALATAQWGAFARDWRRGADALGRPGDRLPLAGALVDALRFAWAGLSQRRGAAGQSTDDIEWNGETMA